MKKFLLYSMLSYIGKKWMLILIYDTECKKCRISCPSLICVHYWWKEGVVLYDPRLCVSIRSIVRGRIPDIHPYARFFLQFQSSVQYIDKLCPRKYSFEHFYAQTIILRGVCRIDKAILKQRHLIIPRKERNFKEYAHIAHPPSPLTKN